MFISHQYYPKCLLTVLTHHCWIRNGFIMMIWQTFGLPLTWSPMPHCLVLYSHWNSYSESPGYSSCQQQQQHCSLLWKQWHWAACVGGCPCGLEPGIAWHSCGFPGSHQQCWVNAGPQAGFSPQPCNPAQLIVPEVGSYISGPGTVA